MRSGNAGALYKIINEIFSSTRMKTNCITTVMDHIYNLHLIRGGDFSGLGAITIKFLSGKGFSDKNRMVFW